jgi:hypothetical protein
VPLALNPWRATSFRRRMYRRRPLPPLRELLLEWLFLLDFFPLFLFFFAPSWTRPGSAGPSSSNCS